MLLGLLRLKAENSSLQIFVLCHRLGIVFSLPLEKSFEWSSSCKREFIDETSVHTFNKVRDRHGLHHSNPPRWPVLQLQKEPKLMPRFVMVVNIDRHIPSWAPIYKSCTKNRRTIAHRIVMSSVFFKKYLVRLPALR
jgi:hypothetical protein